MIINNYEKLYETKECYDMKIYAGEKPNIKEFHVHSFVLRTQCEFFNPVLLQKIFLKKKDDYFILNTNHSPKLFEIILRYHISCVSYKNIRRTPPLFIFTISHFKFVTCIMP